METLPVVLILLGASVASVILCRRYSLPPILGYLLVGTISGPHALSVLENFDAADHGVPQHRERLFIVATRSKHPVMLQLPLSHGQ